MTTHKRVIACLEDHKESRAQSEQELAIDDRHKGFRTRWGCNRGGNSSTLAPATVGSTEAIGMRHTFQVEIEGAKNCVICSENIWSCRNFLLKRRMSCTSVV
jgi:hypothetical protein